MKSGRDKSLSFKEILILFFMVFLLFPAPAPAQVGYQFERTWPTLLHPWYFNQPSDIVIDSLGSVYIADTLNHRIQKFTLDGQFITKWGSQGSGEGQFERPEGIAVDAGGNIYVADTGNHRIQKFTSGGQFIAAWGGAGSEDGQFLEPEGVAVDVKGNVYVADTNNHRIQKFDAAGQFVNQWGGEGTAEGQLDHPAGIAVDDNGDVYVADTGHWHELYQVHVGNYRIQKFTSEGKFLLQWGSQGFGEGQFSDPRNIAIDGSGNIYVTDKGNGRIQKFDSKGKFLSEWKGPDSGAWSFQGPSGIALDASDNVYVADVYVSHIQKFTPAGEFITRWSGYGVSEGQFHGPTGITMDTDGNLYIAELDNKRIQKFTPTGQSVAGWKTQGAYGPSGITSDGNGNFYVAVNWGGAVHKYSPSGELITQWKGEDFGVEGFVPWGIALDKSGNIFVTDTNSHRVCKFAPDGRHMTRWGNGGSGNGQFYQPRGIAIDSTGTVYVVDTWNHRIQKFTPEGQFIGQWGKEGSGDGQFYLPQGIAIGLDGNVYVTDSGRVQKFTPDGRFLSKFDAFDSDGGPLGLSSFLFVSPDKKVYVTDLDKNRVQVLKELPVPVDPTDPPEFETKVIVVAGGGPYPGNTLWETTQACANFAYRTLIFQGFPKEAIAYLTSDTTLDLDGNGVTDDVDGDATNGYLELAIQWAMDAKDVILYITGPGEDGYFQMNQAEALSAAQLNSWLNNLQQAIPGKVIAIYDASLSGNFLTQLTPPEKTQRFIITSTSGGEPAQFVNQGLISFSNYFWTQIFMGSNLFDAFSRTKDALEVSIDPIKGTPLLDADGNGVPNEETDEEAVGDYTIGNGIIRDTGIPVIQSVTPEQELKGKTSATLWAEVTSPGQIARVWAAILRPNTKDEDLSDPVLQLPSVDLQPVGNNRYEGIGSGFSTSGTYEISFYALSTEGVISLPGKTTVVQKSSPTPIYVNSDDPQVNVSFSSGQLVHLTLKTEPNQKIWVFIQLPSLFPGVELVRPSDHYCQQWGRWLFPFTGDTESLWYLESATDVRVDFGTNDLSGTGEVLITVKKGESSSSLETIQTIRLTEI